MILKNKKKGMSEIVTTLLVLVLVIVVVGIIYVAVKGLAEKGSNTIDLNSKCLESTVKVTKATCNATGNCNVTITRESGHEE